MDIYKQKTARAAAEERDFANRARTAAAHGQDGSFYEYQRDARRLDRLAAQAVEGMARGTEPYLRSR
jgi:hypothetical protein